MIELRLRSKISQEELKQKVCKILTDEDYNLLIHKDTTIRGINGEILAVYQRNVIPEDIVNNTYPVLHDLKKYQTNNRTLASGLPQYKRDTGGTRTDTIKPIASTTIGNFDPKQNTPYCRLTAWSGKETEKYEELFPLFQFIGKEMERVAPKRYKAQMEFVNRTHPDWVIPNTPFTTITVNNSYPTGVHTDKGDLDEGISTLAVITKGEYKGGYLTLPEYRIAFNVGHRDLLIFNAHEWHGNTKLNMLSDDAERISVVCYYRENMVDCDSMEEEEQKKADISELRMIKGDRSGIVQKYRKEKLDSKS